MAILDFNHLKPSITRHVYHKSSSRRFSNINLCKGVVIGIDDSYFPVTFVFYETLSKATQDFERHRRINHSGVVNSWTLSDDEGTEGTGYEGREFFVVSFDQFLCFLTENPLAEKLFSAASNIPMIPPEFARSNIKALVRVVKHVYSMGFNCGAFELPKAYVWVVEEDKTTVSLKLFLVDECRDDYSPELWRSLQDDGIYCFGLMLRKYVLMEPKKWIMRDAFLEYFDTSNREVTMCPMDRLSMIEDAPFLEDSIHKILGGMSTAFMAFERTSLPGYAIAELKNALNDNKLFVEICSRGPWRNGISQTFKDYLDKQMKKEGIKQGKDLTSTDINDKILKTLVQWNRNPFQHGSLSDYDIYNEASGRWERLFLKVHLVMWQHKINGPEE